MIFVLPAVASFLPSSLEAVQKFLPSNAAQSIISGGSNARGGPEWLSPWGRLGCVLPVRPRRLGCRRLHPSAPRRLNQLRDHRVDGPPERAARGRMSSLWSRFLASVRDHGVRRRRARMPIGAGPLGVRCEDPVADEAQSEPPPIRRASTTDRLGGTSGPSMPSPKYSVAPGK